MSLPFCFCAPLNIISTGYNVPRGSHDGDGLLLGGTVLGPCGNCNWMEIDGDEYWHLSSSDGEEGANRYEVKFVKNSVINLKKNQESVVQKSN